MNTFRLLFLFGLLTTAVACVPDLRPNDDDDDLPDDDDDDDAGETITTVDDGNGVFQTHVDATDDENWIYLNLAGATEVFPTDPLTSTGWDLGFRRSNIKLNGGACGVGEVELTVIEGVSFDDITAAPTAEWATDTGDCSDGEETVADYAFVGETPWYDYDFSTHILSPADKIYVVRSVTGDYYKVQFLDYYDESGTSGMVSFKWAAVDAPAGPEGWTIQTEPEVWTYLNITDEAVVSVTEPQADGGWDLAVKGLVWKTNSGVSGDGLAGAQMASETSSWDDIEDTDTVGFMVDAVIPGPMPGSPMEEANSEITDNWWDYDMSTHVLTSNGSPFLLRTASGAYMKFRILDHDYSAGSYVLEAAPIEKRVDTHSVTVDASDQDDWAFIDMRLGTFVDIADPSAELGWDLKVRRTQLGTNGGSSGPGLGGALDPMATALTEIADADAMSSQLDTLLPLPGFPSPGDFSGNPVLADWYDYDFMTHAVSPKDKSYVVFTAAGDAARIKLKSYDDGIYELDWGYAGAGQTTF